MGIDIIVTKRLFEPLPEGIRSFGLKDATSRALWRQPEATLSSGIDPVATAVFNRNQVTRLLQEFRVLALESDHVTAKDLADAAAFIERESTVDRPVSRLLRRVPRRLATRQTHDRSTL